MTVITASAGTAYATKANIQRPGPQTEADLSETAAIARINEVLGVGTQPLGGNAAAGLKAQPTVDAGDITTVANAETTKYDPTTL